ncbi:GNAT family N-acetyltransferase [Sphingobacterium sp. lm-10]|uniref:GNAT family N-acetyltransferase n=1 Tax=Sphingobacterium sp. lm-10 TaxID=2944904 RepID=UPI002020D64D|nr:GNAT family N-acetyltransferase [Sphingobacterium sp. lm-10]MCL7986518.1 GNAT family N-acetyltransferase [Sphingobacterium sp. lm-10]
MNEHYHTEQVFDLDKSIASDLADLTLDVVHNGASIGFMDNSTSNDLVAFWTAVLEKVARQKVLLLISREMKTNKIVGTVQLNIDLPPNQPHRADLAKMQVHSRHRRKGIAEELLKMAEIIALQHRKHLLVLDTVTDSAAQQLYLKCGWITVGNIPEYALFPTGELCSTTFMYRKLG